MTSLETILKKHGIQRAHFIEAMGFVRGDSQYANWFSKIAGERKITEGETVLIAEALAKYGVKQKVDYVIDKMVII